jgi:hypothetical protein
MEEYRFMAPRDQDRPATDLLRRSLASARGAEDPCPDPEILAAYSERSLDPDEAARYNLHFSECARCREQLAVLTRSGEFAGATEERRPRTPSAASIWDWRWLAPAAAALVFVAILVALPPARHPAKQPLVAMNQPAAPPTNSVMPESAPAAGAPAPGSSSAAGSMARTSPNLNSAKSETAPPPLSLEVPKKQRDYLVSSLSPSSRNYTESDKLTAPAPAPKVDASSTAGNLAMPAGTSQSVTVDPASPPTVLPARIPAQVAPPSISAGAAAGAASKSARSEHMSAAVATDRSFAQTESVMVQAGDETSARTLVHTLDPQVLWRISSGRFVERSNDAGATWRVQWTNPNAHLVAGAAPTTDTCWLVGRGAMILVTRDGRNWKTITPPADADFVDVAAMDASSATVTTIDDRKFTTSDGGKHWTPAP